MSAIKKSSPKDLSPKIKELGYSIAGISRRFGYNNSTVSMAIRGKRIGKIAREIRTKVEALSK